MVDSIGVDNIRGEAQDFCGDGAGGREVKPIRGVAESYCKYTYLTVSGE